MGIKSLPKSITISLTLLLSGLLLVSPQALTFIDPTALLREASAQELREHILHNRPPPSPDVNDPNLRVEEVFDGLELPTSMAFLGENDILVTEKDSGRVQRIIDGEMQDDPVIDVQVANNDERGLLGIDISNTNGTANNEQYVFLYFTESGGGEDGDDWSAGIPPSGTRLYKYNIVQAIGEDDDDDDDEAQVQLSNGTLLLDLPATPGPRYHGGPVAIGPDNNVYVVIGTVDHHETQAQNFEDAPEPDGTSGVFRITQEGGVADIQGVISEEIPLNLYYGYGIRQSFGMEFDPVTGNLWDTENGPDQYDELNLVEPGFNSGWRDVSGLAGRAGDLNIEDDLVDFDGRGRYSDPEFTWQQTVAPTGLDFLNSTGLGATYQNDLFVGDYNNGNLYHFDLNENRTQLVLGGGLADRALDPGDEVGDILFGTGFGGITDVKVGPDGYLYVLTFQDDGGSIYRIVPEDVDTDDDEADDDTDEAEIEETTDDTDAPSLAQTLVERITRDVTSQ
ncbi:MAG: PQQ-dependent sugar dehydrogenase [Thermoproteota archaeon]|nr:PQQ-dependent sugar dehydrogenase [Thermoproteota archaeon]